MEECWENGQNKCLVIEIRAKQETAEYSKIHLHIHINTPTLKSHLPRDGGIMKF